MPYDKVLTDGDKSPSVGWRKILEEFVDEATVSIIRILKEAYRIDERVPIEQTPYEFVIGDSKIAGSFFRVLTGVDSEIRHYSLVGVFSVDKENDVLSKEKARKLCNRLDEWLEAFPPFRFRNYYENRFSTTIFIACRRFRRSKTRDLAIKSKRHKNTLYVFVPVRDVRLAVSVTLCYFANMIGHRLFRFLNSTTRGSVGRFYGLWGRFRRALQGRLNGIRSSMSNSINYIIEILERVQNYSHGVRMTAQLLFNLFQSSLKEIDKFLKPIVLEIRARGIIEFARKTLRTSYGEIRRVLAKVFQLIEEEEKLFARKYIETLSRSSIHPHDPSGG